MENKKRLNTIQHSKTQYVNRINAFNKIHATYNTYRTAYIARNETLHNTKHNTTH